MRKSWILSAAVLPVVALLAYWASAGVLHTLDEDNIREWLSATSGWAAAIVAVPTILYLSRQIRDADKHQRINFAIQLWPQRILATRTAHIAHTALSMIDLHAKQYAEGHEPEIRSMDPETVDGILHHLRDTTIPTFEKEIAYPVGLGAWPTALVVERAFAGAEPPSISAISIARQFFENIAKQAEDYLAEVSKITGQT